MIYKTRELVHKTRRGSVCVYWNAYTQKYHVIEKRLMADGRTKARVVTRTDDKNQAEYFWEKVTEEEGGAL